MATMLDMQQPGFKKRRASKLDDSDDNKKRGRPRVEKNDESAADRRRTQIRLAQRAYRQRKESTLEQLRRRVTELNSTMDSMASAFRDCMDRLVSMGMSEQAVNELRITANRFQTLKANDAQLRESSQEHDEPVDLAPSSEVIVQKDPLTPKNVSIWLDQTEVGRPRGRQRIDDYLGLGYSLVLPPDHDQSSTYSFRPQPPHATINISPAAGSVFPDFSKLQKMDILNSAIPKEIRPPHIYSFQESSFARRIHRSCLEAGYSLLLDPSRNPPVYERVFKLSLLGRTRQDLITCMRIVLERGPNQPLELYDAPLIHIGGAGTYYPRKDRHGNNVNRKPTYNLGVVGPSTLQLLMQADEQRLTADLTAEIEGYEGEWFDAHDVEGYLQEKGVFVDPLSSFAEVEVQDLSDTSGSSVASSASPETPGANGASDIIRLASPWKPIDPSEVNAIEWNETELVSIGDFGYSDMDGKWVNLNAPARPTTVPGLTNPAKKTVMIDVAKFIRGLLHSAVCLGQTPGFRRKEVDRSLANACFDVFS